MSAAQAKNDLQKYASAQDAVFLQRFFKTGEGQYGAGDIFIGVRMPQIRIVCQQHKDLPLGEIQKLLDSEIHEDRMAGLIILTIQYARASEQLKRSIYDLYLKNVYSGRVNNWDLVDVTTPKVIGEYLADKPRDILFELAKSDDLWHRRVAVLSSFAFIKRGESKTSIELSGILLHDKQDLIQKAVGWMLREVGKRCDSRVLLDFLDKHAHEMPRTMLRYSLEQLTREQKDHYMRQKLHKLQ